MDYSRLRATALKDGEDEEAVTVDTRALIDKVLARYSGEWTTLRELIQNAADAQATTVQIKWETMPSTQVPLPSTTDRSELLKHTIVNHTLRRLVVHNNGQPFTDTDWRRLKRIAEGNPDETKIGAFGVGFYSVFADCEEPFVSSGSQAMTFYWKGNALFTRKLQLPPEQAAKDTAFVLDYRNTTTPIPNLLSVGQFLATSLTFVALENIEFWIDDYKVLALHKKVSPSANLAIPRDLETKTKEGLMKLSSVDRTSAQIDATFMSALGWKPQTSASGNKSDAYSSAPELPSLRSFFSKLTSGASHGGAKAKAAKEEKAAQEAIAEDLTATSKSSIFLRVTSASILTNVSASFATELERATKKPPPRTTKLSILTSSYDETVATEDSSKASKVNTAADVFASVLPSKKPGGRVFIGFPTMQTTGAGMHISAPSVIPTVERESIDLNARWVRTWNLEMLRVAGVMIRLAFANEMSDLNSRLRQGSESGVISRAAIEKFVPEALHILKTYTFAESTPNGYVAQTIEEAFWTAYKRPTIEVYSSQGVMLTAKVRIGSEELSKFVDGIPVVLESMKSAPFIKKLIDFGLVSDISVDDVYHELEAKALDKEQLQHFISWLGKAAASSELDLSKVKRLLSVAVATINVGGNQGDIIALGAIKNFLVPSDISPALPIPPTTLPFAFTNSIPARQLEALGWEPLGIVPWLRFLIESAPNKGDDQNLTKSPKFAVQVLTALSKGWENVNQSSRDSIINQLQNVTIMPTRAGMRKPAESFFPSVKLFDDLPVIENCHTLKDKFLVALGVRKTVDLDTIFTRLLNSSPTAAGGSGRTRWSHMELIKYLASVRNDIPAVDMRNLRASPLCPAEAGPPGMEPTKGTATLYKISDLFEPKDTLRTLKLPILQWPGPPGSFRENSNEARFLYDLGLRKYPTVPELVELMAGPDPLLRTNAMVYFIGNHQANGYIPFDLTSTNKAILPLEGNEKKLVSPSECYTNEAASVLGFNILRKDLHQHAHKFGVFRDPSITACVETLIAKPPRDHGTAVKLFEYFTSRLGDIRELQLSKLRTALIVPVTRRQLTFAGSRSHGSGTSHTYMCPQNCYIGSSAVYDEIFDFVDFGATANAFLLQCGAKIEPTKAEIAQFACGEPARLLSILQSPEKYLNVLRSLAADLPTLKKDKVLFKKMKSSPFLLGWRDVPAVKGAVAAKGGGGFGPFDEDEEATIKQYQLASPNQVSILDDYISFRLFKDSLLCAPEEDALETFYMALGCEKLSAMIQEDVKIGPHTGDIDVAARLRKHVLERSKLFLYEYSRYKPDAIEHDAKWLEANLTVEVVKSVALRRSLRGQKDLHHTERRSAASAFKNGGWVLYIAAEGRPDMYQIGQAVCQLLLNRPSQHSYIFFEPFLKLDLLDLRARGYNVHRILRAKAAEARIAEEERRKALEAEERTIRENSQETARKEKAASPTSAGSKAAEAAKAPEKTPTKSRMPGSFNDSPEEEAPLPSPRQHRGPRSFFSGLTRRLGLDDDDTEKPPHDGLGKRDDGRVTSSTVVRQNLRNAVKATRAYDSLHLFSPPKEKTVKEQPTYCDRTSAKDIEYAADAPDKMKIFTDKFLPSGKSLFLADNKQSIAQFETVLKDAGAVYDMKLSTLHMFYDEQGNTIAFNSNGSIFCNLRFFKQLHAWKANDAGAAKARKDAITWWWVVLAHELAHNLVSTHSASHSYYT